MKKVYLVILDWNCSLDNGTDIEVYDTQEKAKARLDEMVEEEKTNSWIQSVEETELELDEDEDSFYCLNIGNGDRTEIYILEKEVK